MTAASQASTSRACGVRVKPSGRKSFLIQYRNRGGASRRYTLGPVGTLKVEEARECARRQLVDVRDGADAAAERDHHRQAQTVGELAAQYMAQHAAVKKKASSARTDAMNLRNHVLPALGSRKIQDIVRADIARLHHSMAATPGAANRVLALVSKMFNLSEKWGLRPDGTNPCRHVERNRERKMSRFLRVEELGRLGNALAAAERMGTLAPLAAAAIRLLSLTGLRAGEYHHLAVRAR
ncbi:MAG: integrase arm-type DNA-binding domain-containing protein [Dongiaceae bacterium]